MVNAKWGRQGWLSENWNYPLKESLNDQVSFKCHHSKKRQSNSYAGNFKFQYRCCHGTPFFFHCLFSSFSLHTALSSTCKGENISISS